MSGQCLEALQFQETIRYGWMRCGDGFQKVSYHASLLPLAPVQLFRALPKTVKLTKQKNNATKPEITKRTMIFSLLSAMLCTHTMDGRILLPVDGMLPLK
jgi:hypothetical protein